MICAANRDDQHTSLRVGVVRARRLGHQQRSNRHGRVQNGTPRREFGRPFKTGANPYGAQDSRASAIASGWNSSAG